ncbi:MAG: GTP 3',8-cyclase MoaA [Gammaproteobacteria bacterium]|nr:GTP 3',8-cyclase MoaA [Gammaproteobacteria bacterium]
MTAEAKSNETTDRLGRNARDLRISVTDRCNFRCVYCMPKKVFGANYKFLPRAELLSFEELERVARAFAQLGVRKLRITGGEPLVRHDLEQLLERLANIPGIEDLSMTTNASLLTRERAEAIKAAGVNRINVSLDALDDRTFMAINDVGFPVQRVLDGIQNAEAAGIASIKVNMVVKRGANEHSIVPMARFFHGTGHIVRFIEYMDVGHSNGWCLDDVVPTAEIAALIDRELPIEPTQPNYRGEVAKRWRYTDGGGEIGIISSVTQPFCGECTRARLSAVGMLYTCLFATAGHDLRAALRNGLDDDALRQTVASIWGARADRYSERRSLATVNLPKIEMSYIGG